MEISKVSYSPNFQAKLVLKDKRVQKYVKSSFMANSMETLKTLDKFSEIYPDSVVSVNIRKIKNRDYLVAQNKDTGFTEANLLEDSTVLKLNDRKVFVNLIEKIMNKKSFWG